MLGEGLAIGLIEETVESFVGLENGGCEVGAFG